MPQDNPASAACLPVAFLPNEDSEANDVVSGIALCLSGGGYRAMVFHLGAILRLNEAGLLGKLDRISSVSGGSITSGMLGLKWPRLRFDAGGVATNLVSEVVEPIRGLAGKTIDSTAITVGAVLPGISIGDKVEAAYRKHLFGDATLQHLPDHPRFVINATNVQSGALWRFMRPICGIIVSVKCEFPRFPWRGRLPHPRPFHRFYHPCDWSFATMTLLRILGSTCNANLSQPTWF
jgi:NTE family protein